MALTARLLQKKKAIRGVALALAQAPLAVAARALVAGLQDPEDPAAHVQAVVLHDRGGRVARALVAGLQGRAGDIAGREDLAARMAASATPRIGATEAGSRAGASGAWHAWALHLSGQRPKPNSRPI